MNPNYRPNDDRWSMNCPACVVAYEARRRGYNVEAMPFVKGGDIDKLASNQRKAWFTEDGGVPKVEETGKTEEETLAYLKNRMKVGERYTFRFKYKGKNGEGTHIAIAFLDEKGINIYCPQTHVHTVGDEEFMDFSSFLGIRYKISQKIMRIDNLQFNTKVVDSIVRAATT